MNTMKRIPIDESVTRDDVVRAAYSLNLDINNYIQATEERPMEIIYNVRGERTFLHYIDDLFLGYPYIAVSGENASELAEAVAEKVRIITAEDVHRAFATPPSDTDSMRRLLAATALTAPEKADARYLEYLQTGFTHPSPEVRRAAVVAVGYIGWRELAEPLQNLAENDPDADVRRDARAMHAALTEGAR